MFCIGKFPEENDAVAIVPRAWILDDGNCIWPPYGNTTSKFKRAVQTAELPRLISDWKQSPVSVVKIFDSYGAAAAKLSRATITSELSATEDDDESITRKTRRKPFETRNSVTPKKRKSAAEDNIMYTIYCPSNETER
ncbi:unnamed protein product [Allacma fusca]|uniref:Uncharacterized protein n=1 Tax=Allacma fusca TaxID=39272 RepID=A0A8J2K5E9_9HEXA|nr:unnamed protein product [Allacma fusca]